MKRKEVLRKLREKLKELGERYSVASLSVFGSVARDEARADSDVDLVVEFAFEEMKFLNLNPSSRRWVSKILRFAHQHPSRSLS